MLSLAITMHQRPSTRANAVTTPARGRPLIAGEHLAVVDERADLERARAGIDQPREPLARGQLALLVDALDVRLGPSRPATSARRSAQLLLELVERGALVGEGAVVGDLLASGADRDERDVCHGSRGLSGRPARDRRGCRSGWRGNAASERIARCIGTVVGTPSQTRPSSAAIMRSQASSRVGAADDQLAQQAVVERAARRSRRATWVSTRRRSLGGHVPAGDRAGRRAEALGRILGVDPALDHVAGAARSRPGATTGGGRRRPGSARRRGPARCAPR